MHGVEGGHAHEAGSKAGTGIAGLDHILSGGLTRNRVYLLQGDPGSGKTTLAMQFLLEGVHRGERALCVTLETELELRSVAASHGWDTGADLAIYELERPDVGAGEEHYTVFHPSEVELAETTRTMFDRVLRVDASRVVIDSLSEMRLLARDPLRYRRQILSMRQFFLGRDCTVLLLDNQTAGVDDIQLQSLANGVIRLEQLSPDYGAERRRLSVMKLRGVAFRGGYHDFTIRRGGLSVYPRLVAAENRTSSPPQPVPSRVVALDRMLGGGLERGTNALLLGPAGVGKSALATHYAMAAVERGEHAVMFLFDEGMGTFVARAAGLGCPVDAAIASGALDVVPIDPAEVTPGEFAHRVTSAVDVQHATVVVLDSLNGYLNAMPEERFLSAQLHELFAYLRQRSVLVISVVAQHGLLASSGSPPMNLSYLADTVVLLRYFELGGEVRQAISVIKRRSGAHERTIREFSLRATGIDVGEPLSDVDGVLGGAPLVNRSAAGKQAATS